MGMAITVKKMIRKYGELVEHKRRVTTNMGEGIVEYEYQVLEPILCQFSQLTGVQDTVYLMGEIQEADYYITFLPDADVEKHDLLLLDGDWCELVSKMPRKTGANIDYFESLARRRKD